MRKKQKVKENRLLIKMFLCLVYLIIMTILFVCSYNLYEEKEKIIPWTEVETTEEYTYIEISKMSEKFAFYEESNVGLHFVIEEEDTGQWHTYIIAINENEYEKYKSIIDYSYERVEKRPDKIKVYGYPVVINEEIKTYAIKNLPNFVPAENEVQITNENYEQYLTNSYLDTTREKEEEFDIILCASLMLLFIVMALLLLTIFDKDKIVDNVETKLEEEIQKTEKLKKRK